MGIKEMKPLRYLPTAVWFAAILLASFMPSQHIRSEWIWFPHEDKVIHAGMYGGLAFLFLLNSRRFFAISWRNCLLTAAVVSALGGLIEILQPILSNRTCDFADFVANSVGAMSGSLCLNLCLKWMDSALKRRANRKGEIIS